MKLSVRLAAGLLALASLSAAGERLRLPLIFSDQPVVSADFMFAPSSKFKTKTIFSFGGRFSEFGLPAGAARAPVLKVRVDFLRPTQLSQPVFSLEQTLDLNKTLAGYNKTFDEDYFDSDSTLVYKQSFEASLSPGDYNVRVTLQDAELGISRERTLFVDVPRLGRTRNFSGGLWVVSGWGQRLNKNNEVESFFDPNPWRQVGLGVERDLNLSFLASEGSVWTAELRRLRGEKGVLAKVSSKGAGERVAGRQMATFNRRIFKDWKRGVYLATVVSDGLKESITFEVLP